MRVNKIYLKASFVSFLIHAFIILYSLDFFYYESQSRSILSKPINVNLVFKEEIQNKIKINQSQKKEDDIVKSPTTKVEDGYGHFASVDESDAPKIKQFTVTHTSRLEEALHYIFIVLKKTLSYISLGCL